MLSAFEGLDLGPVLRRDKGLDRVVAFEKAVPYSCFCCQDTGIIKYPELIVEVDLPSDVPLVCKHCDAVGDTSYDSRSIPTDSRKAMIQSGDPVPPEFLLTRYDMRAAYEQCLAIHNAIAQKWQVGGTVAPEASKSAAVKEAIANISQVMEMTSKPKTVSSRRPKIDLNSIPPDCLFARRYAMHPLMHMYQPYEHKQAGELDFDTHSAIQAAIASITSIQEAYALLDDYPAPWVLDVVFMQLPDAKKEFIYRLEMPENATSSH